MDKILLNPKDPPRWVDIMLRSPDIWTATVISLLRVNPESIFLAYCVNRLAQVRPDSVKKLPLCLVTYRTYSSIVHNGLGCLRPEKSAIDDLIGVMTIDDLTHRLRLPPDDGPRNVADGHRADVGQSVFAAVWPGDYVPGRLQRLDHESTGR
jgi:hypothetical protein